MKIALLGCGVVGSGVKEICDNHPDLQLVSILVKEAKTYEDKRMITDFNQILCDPSIDCVVEAMGGLHPAYEFILSALQAKKHVITANKAVVAAYMEEFVRVAQTNNVYFLVEASVGGGIPWIKNLTRTCRIDEIIKLSGIFNGTSNFILDKMFSQDQDFDLVLKEAQSLGYAEADPSADIDGFDLVNKCCISANVAYSGFIQTQDIDVLPLTTITKKDIDYFKTKQWVCKYMIHATNYGNCLSAYVEPTLLSMSDVESHIPLNNNIGILSGQTIGELKFYGQGAGKYPTANAIVQDCLDILHQQVESIVYNQKLTVNNQKEVHRYYIRMPKDAVLLNKIQDLSVSMEKIDQDCFFITNQMSVDEINQIKEVVLKEKGFIAGIQ